MDFEGIQYYPSKEKTFMQRLQCMINAYYEDTESTLIGADTPDDDVLRLGSNLSTFPKCINEYVDNAIVDEVSTLLPEDDIADLKRKHEAKCRKAMTDVKKAIKSIETYAAMTQTPHLFTKEETMNMTDDHVLDLIVTVICDVYGEDHMPHEAYIDQLRESRNKLDNTLLSLDYA